MLAARFNLLVNRCKFVRRRRDGTPRWDEVAHFLGVTTNTVRRWRLGDAPIPRAVEIVLETYAALPTEAAQNALAAIRLQDEADTQRNVR